MLLHGSSRRRTDGSGASARASATRWVAEFVGGANVLRGAVVGGRVETPIGVFSASHRNGNGHRNGRELVDVVVRPELLELSPDPAGAAVVVGREFRGHDVYYRLRLDDGTSLCSQRPSTEFVPLGARVALHAHDGPVALFAGDASL